MYDSNNAMLLSFDRSDIEPNSFWNRPRVTPRLLATGAVPPAKSAFHHIPLNIVEHWTNECFTSETTWLT